MLEFLLPYFDPRRRRAVRKSAHELIGRRPWPGEDATPEEIAELALLRLLHLQKEAHRCRRHQGEAAALIARAAIETSITGLYWIHGATDTDGARSENAQAFRRLMRPLIDGETISQELIEDVAATIGAGKGTPNLRDMANIVSERSGRTTTHDLYHRVYVALSTLVSHPTGMALLRHVGPADSLDEVPLSVWSVRAARHATDVCMALLALEMAELRELPYAALVRYLNAHMKRTPTPLVVFLLGSSRQNLRPRRVVAGLKPTLQIWTYYRSGAAASDPYSERERKFEDLIMGIFSAFGSDEEEGQRAIARYFAADLAGSADRSE